MMREQKTTNVEVFNIDGLECFEKDGVAYLKLETVARGLGFTQTQIKNGNEYVSVRWERVRKYLDEFGFPHEWGKDGLPEYIPEDIFYRLAMKANNETAKNFQTFVAQKVLPSLRKHGAYIMGQETMDDDLLLAKAVLAANSMIEERNKKIAQLEVSIAQLTPAADYCQEVLQSENLISTTEIAKDFGFRSAQQLNKILSDLISSTKSMTAGYSVPSTPIRVTSKPKPLPTSMAPKRQPPSTITGRKRAASSSMRN